MTYVMLTTFIYIYLFTRHQSSGGWASPSNFRKWKSSGGKKMFTLAESTDEPQWKWGGYGRGGHGRGGMSILIIIKDTVRSFSIFF